MNTLPHEIQHIIWDYLDKSSHILMRMTNQFHHQRMACMRDVDIMQAICCDGHIRLLKRTCNFKANTRHAIWAAKGGQVRLLRWLNRQNCDMENVMYTAAQYGQLACMQWLHRNYDDCDDECICSVAAQCGHLPCLQWAHEHDYDWNNWTCNLAAQYGHLDCLQYAIENGCARNHGALYNASSVGHLQCVKYLVHKGLHVNAKAFHEAISHDRLKIAQWMVKHGYVIQSHDLKHAAGSCFTWLTQLGGRITQEICLKAALYSNIEPLKMAVAQGFHMNYEILYMAITAGAHECDNSKIVKFLILNGAEWPHSILSSTYRQRYPNLFRWCIRRKFPEHAHLYPNVGASYQYVEDDNEFTHRMMHKDFDYFF